MITSGTNTRRSNRYQNNIRLSWSSLSSLLSSSTWLLLLLCWTSWWLCETAVRAMALSSLVGKRALVTGSSGGIGRAIAVELARQGCHVLVHYHVRDQGAIQTQRIIDDNTHVSASSAGTCVGILQCDFRDQAQLTNEFLPAIDAIWPDGLDIVVNNAGVVSKIALEDDEDCSVWKQTMDVNLHSPLLISQWAVKGMRERRQQNNSESVDGKSNSGGGAILHVSSMHGERSNEYMGAYAASKAALNSLTRTMALEWAAYGVRVNAIAPGPVFVERNEAAFNAMLDEWTACLPAGRIGTVGDIAAACIPLLTNEWTTGSVVTVDGGLMARNNMPRRPRPLKPA